MISVMTNVESALLHDVLSALSGVDGTSVVEGLEVEVFGLGTLGADLGVGAGQRSLLDPADDLVWLGLGRHAGELGLTGYAGLVNGPCGVGQAFV